MHAAVAAGRVVHAAVAAGLGGASHAAVGWVKAMVSNNLNLFPNHALIAGGGETRNRTGAVGKYLDSRAYGPEVQQPFVHNISPQLTGTVTGTGTLTQVLLSPIRLLPSSEAQLSSLLAGPTSLALSACLAPLSC